MENPSRPHLPSIPILQVQMSFQFIFCNSNRVQDTTFWQVFARSTQKKGQLSQLLKLISDVESEGIGTGLSFRFTSDIQLLHTKRKPTSQLISKTPGQAVASRLKHIIKLSKVFPDSNFWLLHLNATKCLTHTEFCK